MPQQWCCPAWLVSSSPCTPSGPMSPPRPVTLAGTRPHVPGPDHTCPGSGVPAAAVLPGPEPGQGPPGTGAQLASYAGLAPVTRRSGSSIRGEVRLPRRQQEAQARHVPLRLRLPALRPRLPGLLPAQTRPRQTALGQAVLPGPPPHPDPARHDPRWSPLRPTTSHETTHHRLTHHIGAPAAGSWRRAPRRPGPSPRRRGDNKGERYPVLRGCSLMTVWTRLCLCSSC